MADSEGLVCYDFTFTVFWWSQVEALWASLRDRLAIIGDTVAGGVEGKLHHLQHELSEGVHSLQETVHHLQVQIAVSG